MIIHFERSQVFNCAVTDGTATTRVAVLNKSEVDMFYPQFEEFIIIELLLFY